MGCTAELLHIRSRRQPRAGSLTTCTPALWPPPCPALKGLGGAELRSRVEGSGLGVILSSYPRPEATPSLSLHPPTSPQCYFSGTARHPGVWHLLPLPRTMGGEPGSEHALSAHTCSHGASHEGHGGQIPKLQWPRCQLWEKGTFLGPSIKVSEASCRRTMAVHTAPVTYRSGLAYWATQEHP